MKRISLLFVGLLAATPVAAQSAPADSLTLYAGRVVRLVSHVLEPGWHQGTVTAASAGTECRGVEVAYPNSRAGTVVLMFEAVDTIEVQIAETPRPAGAPATAHPAASPWKRLDAAALAVKYPACKADRSE